MSAGLGEQLDRLVDRLTEAAGHGDTKAVAAWAERMRSLSEKERNALLLVLRSIKETQDLSALDVIWQIDFERKPVSIDEFLDDPYFLGEEVGSSIFKIWRDELRYVCDKTSPIVELILTGSIGCGKCIHKDALLNTSAGLLTAEELYLEVVANHPVEVLSESGPKTILSAFNEGVKESIRIQTRSGAWDENTPHHRHRVLTEDFEIVWKRNDELKVGDYLVRKPGDPRCFGLGHIDEKLAWLLGAWVANGWKYSDFSSVYLCDSEVGTIEGVLNSTGHTFSRYYPGRKAPTWRISGPIVDLCRSLETGSYSKCVPERIRRADASTVCAFLRGYFDGDGSVSCSTIEASSVSFKLLTQVQTLLWSLGIKSTVRKKNTVCKVQGEPVRGVAYRLSITDRWAKKFFLERIGSSFEGQLKKLVACQAVPKKGFGDNDRYIIPYAKRAWNDSYNNAPDWIKHKWHPDYCRFRTIYVSRNPSCSQGVTLRAVREAIKLLGPDHLHPTIRRIHDEGLIFDEVISIEKSEAQMYDFSVAEDHSYIANGFISHNSHIGALALVYRGPYLCSCLRDPQRYFGLAPRSEIVFGLFNTILDNAGMVNFSRIMQFLDDSKYFKDKCPFKKIHHTIQFPTRNMYFKVGSQELHALGSNLFGYILDEVNFMVGAADPEGQANQLYNHTRMRMESRFRKLGIVPGLAVIISSRGAQTSFLENHIREQRDNPSVRICDYAVWQAKPHDYSKTKFRVVLGDEYSKARIIDVVDPVANTVRKGPDPFPGQQYVEVPVDLYRDFHLDMDRALRDLAGLPTRAISPLIQRVESLQECIDRNRIHPFVSESVELPTNNPQCDLLQMVDWGKLTYVSHGFRALKLHPGQPRFVHVDLALSGDAAGVCCLHPYGMFTTATRDPMTQEVREEFKPKVFVDFIIRIVPTHGAQIDIGKIVSFILNLRNFGYSVIRATFDGFQSAMAIQQINHAGQLPDFEYTYKSKQYRLESKVLSVDKTDIPYTILRDFFNYGALNVYDYPPLFSELVQLEHDIEKKKCDHPRHGSKDVSDALCGALYSCVTHRFITDHSADELNASVAPDPHNVTSVMKHTLLGSSPQMKEIVAVVPPPTPEPNPDLQRVRLSSGSGVVDELARLWKR